jgi:hypothetical protein
MFERRRSKHEEGKEPQGEAKLRHRKAQSVKGRGD